MSRHLLWIVLALCCATTGTAARAYAAQRSDERDAEAVARKIAESRDKIETAVVRYRVWNGLWNGGREPQHFEWRCAGPDRLSINWGNERGEVGATGLDGHGLKEPVRSLDPPDHALATLHGRILRPVRIHRRAAREGAVDLPRL